MSNVIHDKDAWDAYPQHRRYFNKLDLSLRLGYRCGPCGTAPKISGKYIIRPAYNLEGMGVAARIEELTLNSTSRVQPGEFWCEVFTGPHISIDYKWEHSVDLFDRTETRLRPVFACQGYRTSLELYRFNAWRRIAPPSIKLPEFVYELTDVEDINIEYIGGRIIEIHLRKNADFPEDATELIPVWSDHSDEQTQCFISRGWKFMPSFEDAAGNMPIKRLGFLYR